MIISKHKLNSGETIEIRESRISDASKLLKTVKDYVEESEHIPYSQGEFNLSLAEEEIWIESFIKSDNSLLLIASDKNENIIGNISINGQQRIMLKHTAEIGIGILKDWRGKGVGSLLLKHAIEWSKENEMLEQLSLATYASNEAGIALYKKYGFEEIGIQKGFIKIKTNQYEDNLIMTLNLKYNK